MVKIGIIQSFIKTALSQERDPASVKKSLPKAPAGTQPIARASGAYPLSIPKGGFPKYHAPAVPSFRTNPTKMYTVNRPAMAMQDRLRTTGASSAVRKTLSMARR